MKKLDSLKSCSPAEERRESRLSSVLSQATEMAAVNLRSMSMDDAIDLLIKEMWIGREQQIKQYKELKEKWENLEDRVKRMDLDVEKLKKTTGDDRMDIMTNCVKMQEVDCRLLEQEKQISAGALEKNVKDLVQMISGESKRSVRA